MLDGGRVFENCFGVVIRSSTLFSSNICNFPSRLKTFLRGGSGNAASSM